MTTNRRFKEKKRKIFKSYELKEKTNNKKGKL